MASTATLPTAEDTFTLGARLGADLRAGDVVVLSGPLGAGKTVLAKGIAHAMDVDGAVISPTFVLARVHPARRVGAPAMVHVDVYRLLEHTADARSKTGSADARSKTGSADARSKTAVSADLLAELDSLDLDTDLADAVVVVEWGEGLAERLSEHHLDVRLRYDDDSETRTATWEWSR
ncbi:tRNA (adenosine(37)-N6)-threonylcarbamoyltransferase complex ATPase subunit type 1 TsaE [Mycobacterium sp.]|uniref:tRNA (adenosine(37)-N6)-threonylcarbamoyltransferase complex ATPase subunit type 1 TsaE n=1 Tax=Mycobacterium sp. TaxID=1785 RepID=UPI003C770B3E